MFHTLRMKAHKGSQRAEVRAEIEKGIEILAPAASSKEKALAQVRSQVVTRKRTKDKKMEVDA
jgi:hypothetical protein